MTVWPRAIPWPRKGQVACRSQTLPPVNDDKWSTITNLWTLSQQHGRVWIGPVMDSKNRMKDSPNDVNWTGGCAGAMPFLLVTLGVTATGPNNEH